MYARVCLPLRTVAFRGHGFSLLAPARGMPTLWPRQEVCKRWPQRPYLACLPLKKDVFSRPSLKPVPASSSNASEYASSAQGNKDVYSSSPHSAGSSDTCWDWDCALLAPSKSFVPAGQGRLRQRYIARRKLVCIFEESTVLRFKQTSRKWIAIV